MLLNEWNFIILIGRYTISVISCYGHYDIHSNEKTFINKHCCAILIVTNVVLEHPIKRITTKETVEKGNQHGQEKSWHYFWGEICRA